MESGRGLGGGGHRGHWFGLVADCGCAASLAESPCRSGSSTVERDSDIPAEATQREWDGDEVESDDGEVQSPYKGSSFDTMDVLQEALPFR